MSRYIFATRWSVSTRFGSAAGLETEDLDDRPDVAASASTRGSWLSLLARFVEVLGASSFMVASYVRVS